MRQDRPDVFARACELEDLINDRRARIGRDLVWLTQLQAPDE